jgi:hypothetical protein
LGVTFAGPAPGKGGAILNESGGFGVSGHSPPNFLAFNTGLTDPGEDYADPPETVIFASPAHSVSIKAGQGPGGTLTLKAFDGAIQVFSDTGPSTSDLKTLGVAAPRITSLRLEFTGTETVWDDLTWGTAPVSPNDSFGTPANTPLNVGAWGVLGNDTDDDGDTLTAALSRAPANGTVDLRPDGSFTYAPKSGFSGVDSFGYRASDGTGSGNDASVTINVQAPPPPPPPPPLPPGLIPSTASFSSLTFAKFTRFLNLSARNLVAGSSVRVTCKTKRKKLQKRCPKAKHYPTTAARRTLNLRKPFAKKKLPHGTKIVVTITAPGFRGKRITFTTRRGKRPSSRVRCFNASGKLGSCV